MPIEWLDHTADVGFRASGESVEAAFCEAARALFTIMIAPETVDARISYHGRWRAKSHAELLVAWLSDLLAQKDLTGLVFSEFEVTIASEGSNRALLALGTAFGEPLDRSRHQPKTEVKGISNLGLSVEQQNAMWIIQVVVDV